MVRMVHAVSHPAVKKVFIDSSFLHSAFCNAILFRFTIHQMRIVCSIRQADYQLIKVDEPMLQKGI